ncbi:polymer-forming cytoskeletal protein [Sphingobacterium corticis]|uniref:Polymer-forming cytoskeletal protein n=1 Tax=Sphingobacterium corticis TaxID=1812823 RepID=A0ABW5NH74_9SPHI
MFAAKKDKIRKLHRSEELSIETVIAQDISIEGHLIGKESLRIDGKIKGFIRTAKGVIVGESAYVEGDVTCETLIVYGHIVGNVRCKTLLLKSVGTINGDMVVERFNVDMGGKLVGGVDVVTANEPKLLESKVS